jgi:hypothetical protein
MPRFTLQVSQGEFSNAAIETVFESNEAAHQGALAICADLGRDIFAGLKAGSDWRLDVVNETGSAIFQIRLYSWAFEKGRA